MEIGEIACAAPAWSYRGCTLKSFNLKPTVKFPTRSDRTLDQILTNLDDYFSAPTRLPPFGLSDHMAIYMGPGACSALKPKHKTIMSRDKRPRRFLMEVPWSSLLSSDQSCAGKMSLLTEVINYGLDTIMPVCSIRILEKDHPWMSSQLQQPSLPVTCLYSRSLETK